MRTVQRSIMVALACGCLVAVGCGPKKSASTELQRKEAAHHASEGQFALNIRDYARAESLFAKACELAPDQGALWINLGAARIKQGNRSGAKDAYTRALKAYEAAGRSERGEAEPALKQVYVLALLGRGDDARALLEKTAKQFPESRSVRLFLDSRQLERLLGDPKFKEMAL